MPLILASTSPRRRQLLAELGVAFDCIAPAIDESQYAALPPQEQALTLAVAKARDVAAQHPDALVLGGDTLVVLGTTVFGKPESPADAVRMLQQLQGQTHEVVTAIALVCQSQQFERTHVETARVTMRALESAEITAYVATGEPLDKAGAYGVQGLGGTLITKIDGDYYAVVGLPLRATAHLLRSAGFAIDPNTIR